MLTTQRPPPTTPAPLLPSVPPSHQAAIAGRTAIAPKFENGQQWIESLGDVPLSRVIFDPWPGTATEQDLLYYVEVDKRLCESIDGTLVEKPVEDNEGFIAMTLGPALNAHVMPRGLGAIAGGDATLRMASGHIRLPDVSFVATAEVPADYRPGTPVPRLPPTLAVEVLSPGNTAAEMRQKTREYFESGSKPVWLIDPRTRTVTVFTGPTPAPSRTLTEADTLDGGDVLPGFATPIADPFRDPFDL